MIPQLAAYLIAIIMIYGTLNLYAQKKEPAVAALWTLVTVAYVVYSNTRDGFTVPAKADSVILIFGAVLAAVLIYTVIKWNRNEITGMSIKEALDSMPAGACCYDNSGRLFLVNNTMNRLCKEITGDWLKDGAELYEAIKNHEVVAAEDKYWKFTLNELESEGRRFNELIAIDVTTEYRMTRQFYDKNAELENQNARLRKYGENITEITRQKEILAANRNIHDRLNWVLLATRHCIDNSEAVASETYSERDAERNERQAERSQVIAMWREDVLRLASEVKSTVVSTPLDDLAEAADSIGIKLSIDGNLPNDKNLIHVIMLATTESLTNAAKHAGAENMDIIINEHILSSRQAEKQYYEVRISNDGKLDEGEITVGGGLSEIQRLAENIGGTMRIETDGRFELILELPEEEY